MYVRTLTLPEPLDGSSQNFQGLIMAPHCMSSKKFHPDRVVMGVFVNGCGFVNRCGFVTRNTTCHRNLACLLYHAFV